MESTLSGVDSERLYKHTLKTESGKHPLYSPERMEARADHILMEFEGYERNTSWDAIELKDTLSYGIEPAWSRT